MSKKASQDIRNFFTIVSKKTVTSPEPTENKTVASPKPAKEEKRNKKRPKTEINNEDIVDDSPVKPKNNVRQPKAKKLKRIVIQSSSESEDEDIKKTKEEKTRKSPIKIESKQSSVKLNKTPSSKNEPEPKKTYISILEVFSSPVVQSKIKTEEQKVHEDEDFEKTLMELDEEELIQNAITPVKIKETINNKSSKNKKHKKLFEGDTIISEGPSQRENKINEESKQNKSDVDSNPIQQLKKSSDGDSDVSNETPSRKRKLSESENDSANTDLERYEKKRYSAMLYQKYLNRQGPAHLGSKILPKGKSNCLNGCVFIITGVLDSLTREDATSLITSHGGSVVNGVTKKVNYVVCGEDAGPAKLEKAKKQNAHIISEDELIDLICEKSGIINENKGKQKLEKRSIEKEKENKTPPKSKKQKIIENKSEQKKKSETSLKHTPEKKEKQIEENEFVVHQRKNENSLATNKPNLKILQSSSSSRSEPKEKIVKSEIKSDKVPKPSTSKTVIIKNEIKMPTVISSENLSWVDKYKPKQLKDIIGQQGDKSNAKKLIKWLQNWYRNHDGKKKIVRPNPWAKDDDGAYFKAALLSGPPGVGKTTTATIISKELGFDVVEFNASNTRNKRMLHEEVALLLKTTSIYGYFTEGKAPTKKHVLLMDEVDGMSGNEDRGGMQELISLIKDSSIPIICMCNDRQHPKIRSLTNHCFDLRFSKPRLEQIKGQMRSICFKENVDISNEALDEVILGTGMDIRQTLNNLSMWSASKNGITMEVAQKEAKSSQKDTKLGPWEVIRKVFNESDHKTMNLGDKFRLFFHDYSIGPLFVQENYLQVMPHCPKKDILKHVANAADSISMGDIIDSKIRQNQSWALLEMEALFASVLPGEYMKGQFVKQINFPSWLGKNSKRTKMQRLVSELQSHMKTSISGGNMAVRLDYAPHVRDAIVKPLINNGQAGIPSAIENMHSYHLVREDLTSLIEITQWPSVKDPFIAVDSKIKAAFTRAFNKDGGTLPYAINAPIKKKKGTASQEDEYGEYEEEDNESEQDEDDVNNDVMIKAKKSSTKTTKEPKASSSSKGKAPAKPRAKKAK